MTIEIIGKAHREGTSKKTGKPYNFNQLHYNTPAQGVEGMAAEILNVDPSIMAYEKIEVGGIYTVEFDRRGYVVSMTQYA